MYSLKEFWQLRNLPVPEGEWDGNVICIETNVEWTFGTNETHGFLSCYTFTIVTSGWVTILYNNRELTLHEGDLYTYSPGFEVTVLSSSSDYRGICLLASDEYTFELPIVRDAVRTIYFSVMQLGQPCLHLNSDDSRHLQELMQLAIYYLHSNNQRRFESLRLIYSLFLTDLTAMQEHCIERHRFSNRQEELFLGFQRLVTQHFTEHHDIGFYADRLYITTTYLSRIVREVSGGRTVMDFINRLLLMEAVFLLRQTSLSVAQIADRLHFADTTTFARFFTRLKGVSPKEFRKGK